jgi:ring-1,2-phenylacetyl-CoA epoxidase subunit PaaD
MTLGSKLESTLDTVESLESLETLVANAAASVRDPELADVTIGELGLVQMVAVTKGGRVEVSLTPTFLGCPALSIIAADVRSAIESLHDPRLGEVTVVFVSTPVWSPEQINDSGRSKLAQLGIGVVGPDGVVLCPHCASDAVSERVPVGSTSCRSVWWCAACRTVIDFMRTACVKAG